MSVHGPDDNLPAGVTSADPYFHDDDAPCLCDHIRDEHKGREGACECCDCLGYEPINEEEWP